MSTTTMPNRDDVETIITTACGEFAADFDLSYIVDQFMDHLHTLTDHGLAQELEYSGKLWDIIADNTFEPMEEIPAQPGYPTVQLNTTFDFPFPNRDIVAAYLAANGLGVTVDDVRYQANYFAGRYHLCDIDDDEFAKHRTHQYGFALAVEFARRIVTEFKPSIPARVRYR